MYLIAGLGNPGLKYIHTRHNAGFDAADCIAAEAGIRIRKREHLALTGSGMIAGEKVLIAKPQTYMNSSGDSIAELCHFYKIDPQTELIVLSDDIALDVGRIRIRRKGSAGGHNGLKSIIANLKTEDFMRIRIGVGRVPENGDMISHVLGRIPRALSDEMSQALLDARQAASMLVKGEIDGAMNRFN